ncbi:MAG: hypothetical protein WBO24_09675 [Nitrospirales bacterium]
MAQLPSAETKTIVVDWDKKVFKQTLPLEETFLLDVRSTKRLAGADGKDSALVLVRFREYSGRIVYYEQPMVLVYPWKEYTEELITKVTNTENTTTTKLPADATKDTEVKLGGRTQERTGEPFKVWRTVYRVEPLRSDFGYVLMTRDEYNTAVAKMPKADIASKGLAKTKDKFPEGYSFLNYDQRMQRTVTAILGFAAMNAEGPLVRPCVGARINFDRLNREIPAWQAKKIAGQGGGGYSRFFKNFSLDLAMTLGTINNDQVNRYDLFGTSNLLTGVGYRMTRGLYLSAGANWYNMRSYNDQDASIYHDEIKASGYVSLSLDWDIGASLNGLKKALGLQ